MFQDGLTLYNVIMELLKIVIIPVVVYLAKIDKRTAVMKNDIDHIKENCKYHREGKIK